MDRDYYGHVNPYEGNMGRRRGFTFFGLIKFLSIILCVLVVVMSLKAIGSGDENNGDNTIETLETSEYLLDDNEENETNENIDDIVTDDTNPKIEEVINSYHDLGIVKCDGFINFRNAPDVLDTRSIVGLMKNGYACDILEWDLKNSSTYCKVKSGGITGYIAKQYVARGDEAKRLARVNIKDRAIVLVDKLRMRSGPSTDSEQVGTTYKGERYDFVSEKGDWIEISADNVDGVETAYINSNNKTYVDVVFCLNEARNQNLKNDVINYYDNIGVSTAKDYLNIRKAAKSNSSIVGKLPGKGGCEVLGSSGDFYKIRSGKVTGYVAKKYLATGKRAEDLAKEYADLRAIVKIPALRVRTGPGTKYKQWTTITKEETYIVSNQLDGWVEIELDGGENNKTDKGYISTKNNYVEVRYALDQAIEFKAIANTVSSTRKKLVETAMKYLGKPYVWGGNNLDTGVDCSGFVQQIFKKYGVTMPRVSYEQAKKGTAIKSSQMKPGDLIFYSNSDGKVDHVAIYIGNNQIIHAANRRAGIKISNYNYRTPVAIRNVLGK